MRPPKSKPAIQQEPMPGKASGAEIRPSQAHAALRNFRIIFSSVRRHFHGVEQQCGVSGAQLWAMGTLLEKPGCRVSDLARAMSIHQSTTSNLLDKLAKRGLVAKKREGPDQRVVRLYLTPQGEEIMRSAPKPFEGVLPHALQNLPTDVLANLNAYLARLIDQMAVKDEAAASTPLSDIE